MAEQTVGAEGVIWTLADLLASEAEVDPHLEAGSRLAQEFAGRYRGRVGVLSPAELREALCAFEAVQDHLDRVHTYAFLQWCSRSEEHAAGALLQRVREVYTRTAQELLFFELELSALPAEELRRRWEDPELAAFRHFLELLQQRSRHLLSEPEERMAAEKSITGIGAWTRYFDETLAAARFELDGRALTEQEILALLHEHDRNTRRSAAMAFTAGLRKHLRTLTYVMNTVLAEKASEDRMRRFEHWLAARNLANEITDGAVQALVEAVVSRYDLVERFYGLKRRLLGLDELYDYDRYAPVGVMGRRFGWEEAREIVTSAYARFSPVLGDLVSRFFAERWIDAGVRAGKRAGAFSHRAVPQVHPYILMNYTGRIRDVQTLAHELGHGVHQYLSRERGSLQGNTPLTTAETASVFGEMLVFDALRESEKDPSRRLSLLVSKIDDIVATVFRQVAMNRFEDQVHNRRRRDGELSPDDFTSAWLSTQREMFRGSVTLGDHYGIWWSYIPHFIHTPGYVYSYAFGELLVLALYSIYRRDGRGFVERYLKLLSAGGSDWPHRLLEPFGVDLQDPGFWYHGLREIEALLDESERLAAATGSPVG
jgi:oligoendopeptidase F